MAGNPYPVGLNFGGAAATRLQQRLHAKARQNAQRIQCAHCELMILPDNMGRHVALVHEDDDE